jgi:hypothetical protein
MLNEQLNPILTFQKQLKNINFGLLILAFVGGAYFLFILGQGQTGDMDLLGQKKVIPGIAPDKVVKRSLKFYDRILSRRKLFAAQAGIENSGKKSEIITSQSEITFSELELLGIVTGAKGPQAIINNIKSDRSYYCYGQENIEGFLIEKVLNDRVILKKGEEKFELRL